MATKSSKSIGCIGKCTSGLTLKELDQITDNINQTLLHPLGRSIFRKYLTVGRRKDALASLDLYETCCEFMEKEENYLKSVEKPTLDSLRNDLNTVMSIAEDLDIPEIDLDILKRLNDASQGESRETMLSILYETKVRLMDHLRNTHRGFRIYVMQPCPKTK